jgi:hypothetical protein
MIKGDFLWLEIVVGKNTFTSPHKVDEMTERVSIISIFIVGSHPKGDFFV